MTLVCYHGKIPHKVSQERTEVILRTMTEPDYRKIIVCIKNKSKTASEISKETGFALSNVYRKVRKLEENQLLILSGNFNLQKKREFRYKSKIRKIIAVFEKDVMDVKIYSNLRNEPFL